MLLLCLLLGGSGYGEVEARQVQAVSSFRSRGSVWGGGYFEESLV